MALGIETVIATHEDTLYIVFKLGRQRNSLFFRVLQKADMPGF